MSSGVTSAFSIFIIMKASSKFIFFFVKNPSLALVASTPPFLALLSAAPYARGMALARIAIPMTAACTTTLAIGPTAIFIDFFGFDLLQRCYCLIFKWRSEIRVGDVDVK